MGGREGKGEGREREGEGRKGGKVLSPQPPKAGDATGHRALPVPTCCHRKVVFLKRFM